MALARGTVPREIEVREGGIRYLAAPWDGQKTGAFLDQRPNRLLAGALAAPGRPGARLLRLPRLLRPPSGRDAPAASWRSTRAPRRSRRGAANAALNGLGNIEWREGDAFETLRAFARASERFDTIVLDPPGFAKNRAAVAAALRGYREINLRAMRALAPGGILLTASLLVPCPAARVPRHAGRRRGGQRPAGPSCAGFWARARTIPRCSPSPRPAI